MNDTLQTRDGVSLHVRAWPLVAAAAAASGPARGSVLIVHGLGEHIGRHAHVAAHLNGWGWNVVGFDQRGHGRSGGARGRLAAPDDLLRDLSQVIDAMRAENAGPLVLLGHSMGGLVAARFVAEGTLSSPAAWHRNVDALVLSSPALDPGMSAAQRVLLSLLGPLAPNLALGNGLLPEWLSRDPAVVAAYLADTWVHDRITPRLARFILDAGAFVRAQASHWKLPTLLMYASSDRCVAPAGSREFAAAAPPGLLSVHEFGPLFHEIFNEPEQADVFAVLGAWLAAREHRENHG